MPVTKKDIYERFNISNVEQIGKKQLFTGIIKDTNVLISYYTIVGVYDNINKIWVLTLEKYSHTTTCQMHKFMQDNNCRYARIEDYIKELI